VFVIHQDLPRDTMREHPAQAWTRLSERLCNRRLVEDVRARSDHAKSGLLIKLWKESLPSDLLFT
jgi:hypothetical protein